MDGYTDITIEQKQQEIEEAKEKIELADALERLNKNEDFIRVIGYEYCNKEAIRLVHLLGDTNYGNTDSEARRKDIYEMQMGIARLCEYFRRISFNGNQGVKTLMAIAQAEEDARKEKEQQTE